MLSVERVSGVALPAVLEDEGAALAAFRALDRVVFETNRQLRSELVAAVGGAAFQQRGNFGRGEHGRAAAHQPDTGECDGNHDENPEQLTVHGMVGDHCPVVMAAS